jgi:hypothetical protein
MSTNIELRFPEGEQSPRDQDLGSHPYFTRPQHTLFAREVLGSAPLLVPELAFTLASDPAAGAATARGYADRFLKLPNYTRNLKGFGFGPRSLEGVAGLVLNRWVRGELVGDEPDVARDPGGVVLTWSMSRARARATRGPAGCWSVT